MPYDIRAVANLLLHMAETQGRAPSNLHINKVLFFVYADYMREFKSPLTTAKIEAWKYGPVFREIYHCFKPLGKNPITMKARKVDYETGELIEAADSFSDEHREFIENVGNFYMAMPTGVLVDFSHRSSGAWAQVWNHAGDFNIGMEITPELVEQYEVNSASRIRKI